MKIAAFTFALLLHGVLVSAQKHDNIWMLGFGDQEKRDTFAFLDFAIQPLTITTVLSPQGFVSADGPQILCDSSGRLICYSNGCNLVNKKHQYMLNGDSLNIGEPWEGGQIYCKETGYHATQSFLFLPYPAHENQYIFVHLNQRKMERYPDELLYTVIDAAAEQGNGVVTEKAHFVQDADYADALTAVKHGNGRDWWIVAPIRQSNTYHIFLLSPQGISRPKVQEIGSADLYDFVGQAVFSPDGTQYARHAPFYGKAQLMSFDRCSGEFCCPRDIKFEVRNAFETGGGGLAFSSNSRLLYISITQEMFQLDTWSTDPPLKIADFDGFESPLPAFFFQQTLAPDGKIYMGTSNGTDVLHVVHSPDSMGLACQFEQHAVKLPVQHGFSMPNFPHYRLYDLRGSVCDSLGIDAPIGTDTTWAIPKDQIKIWPNPADQEVTITIPPKAVGPFRVFNVLGQLMYEIPSVRGSLSLTLDVANYPAGVYLVTVFYDNDFHHTARLVVARGR